MRLFMVLLLSASCLFGCATLYRLPGSDLANADKLLQQKKFKEAAASYDRIAKDSAGTSRGAEALFDAAKIRASYDNPHRDFPVALQKFDEFVHDYPKHEKIQEAQNWRFFVRTILELRRENEHLSQNIEQLKKIDIKHEERRKGKRK